MSRTSRTAGPLHGHAHVLKPQRAAELHTCGGEKKRESWPAPKCRDTFSPAHPDVQEGGGIVEGSWGSSTLYLPIPPWGAVSVLTPKAVG